MKLYQCKKCKKTVEVILPSRCPTMCCGEAMEEMIPGSVDAAAEKHVPEVSIAGNIVTVTVGSVEHPMLDEHYIMWIALETTQGIQRKPLSPGAAPKAVFSLAEGETAIAAYEYCNLHGLWKKEV